MDQRREQSSARREQLKIIYETAPMGIALMNNGYAFITCNPALLNKLGYSYEDLKALSFLEICHPWDRKKAQNAIQSARKKEEAYLREEIRLVKNNGEYLWVEISLQHIPETLDRSDSFVVMIQNIQRRKEYQLELMELRRRLHEKSEMERNALAQNLHDGPMQDLHSISFQIAGLVNNLPEDLAQPLKMIRSTVHQVIKDLRVISYNLRPAALSKFGLAQAIKAHAEEYAAKHHNLKFNLELTPDANVIKEDIRLTLFRIYQQALGNIIRHAEASEVTVRLDLDGDHVTLEVIDDGNGFQVPDRWVALARAGHYGLAGTSDRIDSLGGKFQVISSPDNGTRIGVQIPDYMEE